MPGIIDKIFGKTVTDAAQAIGGIVDQFVTNDEERLKMKSELTKIISDLTTDLTNSAKEVLVTEMSGNWLQRSWRPILMLAFGLIVVYRYFIGPTFGLPLPVPDIPEQFWSLLEIGIGGYVIGRSAEKIIGTLGENLDKLPGKKAK